MLTLAVYAQTFDVPFIFDDVPTIVENPAVRSAHSLIAMLFPEQPDGLTSSGRPLVSLSLALNYIVGGENVAGYHLFNLGVHIAAGLVLFGLARRTFLLAPLRECAGVSATPLALGLALLWSLHPLQTESVTYIVQRAEALMGLFYLLTLYTFVRGVTSESPQGWFILSGVVCVLGMASKEVMVSAPLIVWFYDRTFVAGTFRAAWRQRRGYYLGLAATWFVLVGLVISTGGDRGGTMGAGTHVSAVHYWAGQFEALTRYLGLSFWPAPQIFEYGPVSAPLSVVLPCALFVVTVIGLTLFSLRRWPLVGFAGAWFFCILAPTFVMPGTVQTIAEHRMYLALAPLLALPVLLLHRYTRLVSYGIFSLAILVFGFLTWRRNEIYRSNLSLWSDTVVKRPGNPVAHTNLGLAFFHEKRFIEAISHYETALKLSPGHIEASYNLAIACESAGRLPEALLYYEATIRLNPAFAEAHNNWGHALVEMGRPVGARTHYEQALALKPSFAEPANNLGLLELGENRVTEARVRFMQALQINPAFAEAYYNLGNLEAQLGSMTAAAKEYAEAIRLRPDYAEAELNWGNALLSLQQLSEAIAHYQSALRLRPDWTEAQLNLGLAFLQDSRFAEAVPLLERVVKSGRAEPLVYHGLGFALAQMKRRVEAVANYEIYLQRVPSDDEARAELAQLRMQLR